MFQKVKSRAPLLALILVVFSVGAIAHNKVVVVNLGDSPVKPFAPVAPDSPPNGNYTIGTETVVDKVTGLEWQKVHNNNPIKWQDASVHCTGVETGGKTDWRLPDAYELNSIVDYGTSGPAINTSVFPSAISVNFWSDTAYVTSPNALAISFTSGSNSYLDRELSRFVRCVRTNNSASGEIFTDNGDGTVTDVVTGLMWQHEDNVASGNWNDAISYCQSLSLGGKSDWRLPGIKELYSIVVYRLGSLGIPPVFSETAVGIHWTATREAATPDMAWSIFFLAGTISAFLDTTEHFVRCVRE